MLEQRRNGFPVWMSDDQHIQYRLQGKCLGLKFKKTIQQHLFFRFIDRFHARLRYSVVEELPL